MTKEFMGSPGARRGEPILIAARRSAMRPARQPFPHETQTNLANSVPADAGAPWPRLLLIGQQVVLHQIGEAARPGFVRVAANVDAVDELQFPGRYVGHVNVQVENEVGDLLNDDPCNVVSAKLLAVVELSGRNCRSLDRPRFSPPRRRVSAQTYIDPMLGGRIRKAL